MLNHMVCFQVEKYLEFESAMMVDNLTGNRINIDKTDMTIKKKDILFNL